MKIVLGDKVLIQSEWRSKELIAIVTDISDIDGSVYYRVTCSNYDHWVHTDKVLKRLAAPTALLFDDANTVIRHLDDLYK